MLSQTISPLVFAILNVSITEGLNTYYTQKGTTLVIWNILFMAPRYGYVVVRN